MKTTLCETCVFGLVREWDCGKDNCNERHFMNKCMLGEDYPGSYITSCNEYDKIDKQTTYHDPDYAEFEKKILEKGDILQSRSHAEYFIWPICPVCRKPDTPYVDPESCQCYSYPKPEGKLVVEKDKWFRTGYSCPNCGEPVDDPVGPLVGLWCRKCGYGKDGQVK